VCLRGAIDYALSGEHAGVRRLGRSLYLATRYLCGVPTTEGRSVVVSVGNMIRSIW
jgi:hypothetical protein